MARVTVLEREGGNVRLRIEELIGTVPALQLSPGDEVESRFDGYLPCGFGTTDVMPGQQALAFFMPNALLMQNGSETVSLTPWTDDLLFAQTDQAQLFVPASELAQLAELIEQKSVECRAMFGDISSLPGVASDDTSNEHCVRDDEHMCEDEDAGANDPVAPVDGGV